MAHNKVYAICENMCIEETKTKEQIDSGLSEKSNINHNHDSVYSKLGHTHTKSQITDFAHTHTKSQITDFAHTHTKSQITDFAHNHDDRYYTKSETDTKLSGKSDTSHNHDGRYYTETESDAKYALKTDVQKALTTKDVNVTVSSGSTSGSVQVAYPEGITRDNIVFVGCQFKASGTSIWNYSMGNLSGNSNKEVSISTTQDSTFLVSMSLKTAVEQNTTFVVRITMAKVSS